MRILHTVDWHLGCHLENHSRQPEHERFLDELCLLVREESVDLVLMAGDVYDTPNPPAVAEQLYCDALARLGEGGRRGVVAIAGNHDQPERLSAVKPLANRHGAFLFGYPQDDCGTGGERVRRVAGGPGWVELAVAETGESAVILALPYPSEHRLRAVLADTLDERILQAAYSDRVGAHFTHLSQHFRPDAVRLAMSHLFVAGGRESDSERPIHLGGAYTVAPGALPNAQYVALGHLHRPQWMRQAPAATRYAGSPLALSFSETGQAKSVTVVELHPEGAVGEPREIPLSSGKPLVRWEAEGGLAQVEAWVDAGRDVGAWIDLAIRVTEPLPVDAIQRLRRMHSGFVYIRPVFPAQEEVAADREERARLTLEEQFVRFYSQRTGAAPPAELVRLFLELATGEEAEVEA